MAFLEGRTIALLPVENETMRYHKANLHCHTVISDGRLTPEEIKAAYQEQGYAIVAYTDHREYRYHRALCDTNFLALAAYEVDINDFGPVEGDFEHLRTYHLNLYDTKPEENAEIKSASPLPERRYRDKCAINGYISRMNALGFLVCYNHPYWSLQNSSDFQGLRGLWGMEIYNHGCEHDGLYGYHPQAYDEMLRDGQRICCVSTDDNHNSTPFDDPMCDSFGGFTMIASQDLNYASVIAAMRQGRFYCSQRPQLHGLTIENGELIIRTSPVEKIFVHLSGRNCYKKLARHGETTQEARFPLTGKEGLIRVECRDGSGFFANSNAYYLDDIAAGRYDKPLI